jgi:CRISPR-associated Cas5-like protein
MSYGIKLHTWGQFACYTRPAMEAERVSYAIITPFAARGVSSKPSIENPRSAASSPKSP